MYCKSCGAKLDDGAKFCARCGCAITGVVQQKNTGKATARFVELYANKLPLCVIIMNLLSLILALCLIFLPIFRFEYTPQSLEEWEMFITKGNWSEYMFEDTYTADFSYFQDLRKGLFADYSSWIDDEGIAILNRGMGFSIFIIMILATSIFWSVKWIIEGIYEYSSNAAKHAEESYAKLQRKYIFTMKGKKKVQDYGQLLPILMMVAIPAVTIAELIYIKNTMSSIVAKAFMERVVGFFRPMLYFSGVSPLIIIVIALIGLLIGVIVHLNRLDKELLEEIDNNLPERERKWLQDFQNKDSSKKENN